MAPGSLDLGEFAARPLSIGVCVAFVIALLMRETYPTKLAVSE
jgi:hypothetical protein